MQIASITPVAHPLPIVNSAAVTFLSSSSPAAATALPAMSAKPSVTPVSAPETHPVVQSSPAAARSAPATAAQSVSSSSLSTQLVAGYPTTVNGTHYTSSIDESGGVYTATVPTIPVVTASGATVTAAENNLNLRIDVLV
jgi:hypothetical protein